MGLGKWEKIPALNFKKFSASVVIVKNRYLYVISGGVIANWTCTLSKEIEVLDTFCCNSENNKWKMLQPTFNMLNEVC